MPKAHATEELTIRHETILVSFDPSNVNALAVYRHAAGMSRKELAERIGSTYQTVWLWESGRGVPSPVFRDALSKLLKIPGDQLLLLMLKFPRPND